MQNDHLFVKYNENKIGWLWFSGFYKIHCKLILLIDGIAVQTDYHVKLYYVYIMKLLYVHMPIMIGPFKIIKHINFMSSLTFQNE